jgi:hypothetical protein
MSDRSKLQNPRNSIDFANSLCYNLENIVNARGEGGNCKHEYHTGRERRVVHAQNHVTYDESDKYVCMQAYYSRLRPDCDVMNESYKRRYNCAQLHVKV